MKACIAQWKGTREAQEDAYTVKYFPEGVLAVVCDGMGGHQQGALAAQTAVKAFLQTFEAERGRENPADCLCRALEAANSAVGQELARLGAFGGTTLVAAYMAGGVLWWVSVGDSPLLLWRHQRLVRLNADHSLRDVYMQYVKAGFMSYEEAMSQGHRLRSALTGEPLTMVDAPPTPYPLLPGDRLILASDGVDDLLLPAVLPEEVKTLLNTRGEVSLAALIVDACMRMQLPAADNTTVVCLDRPL